MPDITMCQNNSCSVSNCCKRHEVQPNELWQSYATFEPIVTSGHVVCDSFIRMNKEDSK